MICTGDDVIDDDTFDFIVEGDDTTQGNYNLDTRQRLIHPHTKNEETIEETALNLFEMKHNHGIKETAMNTILKNILHDHVLPSDADSLNPKSMYTLSQALGVPDIHQYQYDACPKDCYVFAKGDDDHLDCCPKCSTTRYVTFSKPDGSIGRRSAKVTYDFHIEKQIAKFHKDKTWLARKGTHRDVSLNGFWGSEECKRMDRLTNGEFSKKMNGVYDMCGDGVELYITKSHSCTVFSIR